MANSKDNAYHPGSPETAPCNSSCTGKVPFCGDGTCQVDSEEFLSCAQDGCMPVCGNGVVEEGEACDDGNLENTAACLNNCKPASCGDGFLEAGVEECDDTNLFDDDACPSLCKPASCGDGFTWKNMEQCDHANVMPGDGCSATCVLEACGNKIVDPTEARDDGKKANFRQRRAFQHGRASL